MRTGEIDHHGADRRLDGRRPFVLHAEKDQLGAACQRLLVRDQLELGDLAGGEARIEHACRPTGKRIRAKRYQLQLGVEEDAV